MKLGAERNHASDQFFSPTKCVYSISQGEHTKMTLFKNSVSGFFISITFFLATLVASTQAHASATNCDYRTWYGYSTGNSGDYAQCMIVKGRSDLVWEMQGDIHQWVHYGLGPLSPVPVPNVSNVCTRIQFKYKRKGYRSYSYSNHSHSCHRPAVINQQTSYFKPRHGIRLADRSNVCMRYKNEKTGNSYTGWTCIQIKK